MSCDPRTAAWVGGVFQTTQTKGKLKIAAESFFSEGPGPLPAATTKQWRRVVPASAIALAILFDAAASNLDAALTTSAFMNIDSIRMSGDGYRTRHRGGPRMSPARRG